MEHKDPQFEESHGEVRGWFQENLRVIVSIFIVAAIALGIYSYSRHAENLSDADIASLLETKGDNKDASTTDTATTQTPATETKNVEEAGVSKGTVVTPELSKETDGAFVETAEAGDGMTHLARRALTHTLEQDQNISLSAEQKVYVEDYLRKNVDQKAVSTGTSVEFSKEAISKAIDNAKALNGAQLANLKKYSQRVSSYR